MKAMILAAGFGTRLAPLTDHLPKALVPVAGRPMIEYAIDAVAKAGCASAVVNAHHHADAVEAYVRSHRFPIDVAVLREEEILGTGGGILNAGRALDGDEPIIVHNADVVSGFDLTMLVAEHRRHAAFATLALNRRTTSRALLFDARMRFLGKQAWHAERGGHVQGHRYGFCGIHVIDPAIFRLGFAPGFSDIFDVYRFAMDREFDIRGMVFDGPWHDLGSVDRIRAFESANRLH